MIKGYVHTTFISLIYQLGVHSQFLPVCTQMPQEIKTSKFSNVNHTQSHDLKGQTALVSIGPCYVRESSSKPGSFDWHQLFLTWRVSGQFSWTMGAD